MAATPEAQEARPALFIDAELKTLETVAKRRGFRSAREYLVSLVTQDTEQHGEVAPIVDDELDDPVESFRRAWAQVQKGELLTEDEFWQAVADDE